MNDFKDSISGVPEINYPTHNKSYNIDDNRGNPRVNGDLREIVLEALFQDTRIDTRDIKINVIHTYDIELIGTVPHERMIGFIEEDIRALGHVNFVNKLAVKP